MNLLDNIREKVINMLDCIKLEMPADYHWDNYDNVTVEIPQNPKNGDLSTNAAMVLCNEQSMRNCLAQKIVEQLKKNTDFISNAVIAGSGFVNITLQRKIWDEIVVYINSKDGYRYGLSDVGHKKLVNVEFASANPTGPMHVGNLRGAIFGDVIARVLEAVGYDITREYMINDTGKQIQVLVNTVFLRYREAIGETIVIPEGLYPGEYLIPVANKLYSEYGQDLLKMDEFERYEIIRKVSLEMIMNLIIKDLKDLGINYDVFTSENELHKSGAVEKLIIKLQEMDLVYSGKLDKPKSVGNDEWESEEQLLFKSSKFGDDMDRPVQRSNGVYTYFASDIAYYQHKLERGYDILIMELGMDHSGYVKRMKAISEILRKGDEIFHIKLHQIVNFYKNGEKLKMSKRSGNVIGVDRVINEVGADAIRFLMLTRKSDAMIKFDIDIVKQQTENNPVFYVQYAHARVKSVLRIAEELDFTGIKADFVLLGSDTEFKLIKCMAKWPNIIKQVLNSFEPHKIAFYLQELAAIFHELWNKGCSDTCMRFIQKDKLQLTLSRLELINAVSIVIKVGLNLIGIKAKNSM